MSETTETSVAEEMILALVKIEKAEAEMRVEFEDLYLMGSFNGARAKAWRKLRQCGDDARKLLKSTNQSAEGLRS